MKLRKSQKKRMRKSELQYFQFPSWKRNPPPNSRSFFFIDPISGMVARLSGRMVRQTHHRQLLCFRWFSQWELGTAVFPRDGSRGNGRCWGGDWKQGNSRIKKDDEAFHWDEPKECRVEARRKSCHGAVSCNKRGRAFRATIFSSRTFIRVFSWDRNPLFF